MLLEDLMGPLVSGNISCLNYPSILYLSIYVSISFVLRSVERLDIELERWVPVEPMLSRRSTLGVAVLHGELYAVGGFDGNNGLDTVEKYNPGNT